MPKGFKKNKNIPIIISIIYIINIVFFLGSLLPFKVKLA